MSNTTTPTTCPTCGCYAPTGICQSSSCKTRPAFACVECLDTFTIDRGGREIACPYCRPAITIRISGLGHGLGMSRGYDTCSAQTGSSMTFTGTRSEILNDVVRVRRAAEGEASRQRVRGRNSITSGAIAIERHVRRALAAVAS